MTTVIPRGTIKKTIQKIYSKKWEGNLNSILENIYVTKLQRNNKTTEKR